MEVKLADLVTDALFNPEAWGFALCGHCNGYGSSLKDSIGVDTCTSCGGSGLVRKEKEDGKA